MNEPMPEAVPEPGGELVPYDQTPAEIEAEFASYPEDVRLAAVEYARGLVRTGEVVPQEVELDAEPQFILIGTQQHGRSLLFVSTAVRATRFARRVEGVDRVQTGVGYARIPRMSILAAAELTSFEQIYGGDCREALQTLLREWDRKAASQRRHPALPSSDVPEHGPESRHQGEEVP